MLWTMKFDERKLIRSRIQVPHRLSPVRDALSRAVNKLPEMLPVDEATQAKYDTLTRQFLMGGIMPTRVTRIPKGKFAVRVCVGGIAVYVAIFASLGGRENGKLCVMMTRLADAIAYHFRDFRIRGNMKYNYSVEQAKEDSLFLSVELEAFSKLLVECGVPMGITREKTQTQTQTQTLESRIAALESRLAEWEKRTVIIDSYGEKRRDFPESTTVFPASASLGEFSNGIPSSF
jgi:hypothetical protein